MTEREPSRGLRFDAWHLLRFVAAAAVAMSLFVASFSHISYELYGDPSIYFHQLNVLRGGHLETVGPAPDAGDDGDAPVRMKTEGGFAMLLWLCRSVHLRLPFCVNGAANALFLLGLFLLVRQSLRDHRWGLFAALVFIATVFSNPTLSSDVWAMSRLYRDTSAHLLGVAGFLAAGFAVGRERRGRWLFLAGLAIGLAAWFRIPDILFAVPAGVLALLHRPWGERRRALRDLAVLALGVGAGLLPLVAQTLIEGRGFAGAGQIATMTTAAPGAVPRLRPGNLPRVLPAALQAIRNVFPKDRLAVFAVLAAASLIFALRRATALLAAPAAFLLFYACYVKIIPRYLLPVFLFMAAVAAVGLVAPMGFLTRKHPGARRVDVVLTILVLAAGGLDLHLVLRSAGDFAAAERVWRSAVGVGRWVNEAPGRDVFITSDQNLGAWLTYFGESRKVVAGWAWYGSDEEARAALEPPLAGGQGAYFVNVALNGVERMSWWKDGLLNHFDLGPPAAVLPYREAGETVVCYPVRARACRDAQVPLAPTAGPTRWLYLPARGLSGTNRWQEAEISCPGLATPVRTRIQAGPNLLDIPCDVPPTGGAVTVRSASPLPSFLEARANGEGLWTIDFTRYDEAYTHARWVEGEYMNWRGFRKWERDWGGYGEGYRSRPEVALPRGSSIRLPAAAADLRVRVFGAALLDRDRAPGDEEIPPLMGRIRLEAGGAALASRFTAGDPFRDGAHRFCEFVEEGVVPAAHLRENLAPDLVVRWPEDLPVKDVVLRHVQIGPAAPTALAAQPSIERAAEGFSWTLPQPPAWRERPSELKNDPTFAFTEPDARVPLTAEGTNVCVMLSWHDPKTAGSSRRTLTVGCGGRTLARFPLEARAGHGRVLVPIPPGTACDHLEVRFEAPEREGEARCVFRGQTLWPEGGLVCQQLSMDPEDPFACFLRDFWTEAHYEKENYYRWTTGDSAIAFPILGVPQDTQIGLRVEGPPAAAGAVRLDVMLNNLQVFATRIANEVGQTIQLRVPARHLKPGLNVLRLKSGTWRPSQIGLSDDDRPLGFKLMGVSWSVGPTPPPRS